MKKKIIILIILLVITFIGCFFYFYKEKTPKINEPIMGITSITDISEYDIEILDDYYLKETETGFNTYDFNGQKLHEFKAEFFYTINNYIDIDNTDFVDKNGNTVIDDKDFAYYNGYYLVNGVILDKNMQEVYQTNGFKNNGENTFLISNDILLIEDKKQSLIV
ncbi:MAG: hypothetical protein K2J20_00110, partial [Bacilli bacterium]|nr:hypothetical protein [Bacilli bacterium]